MTLQLRKACRGFTLVEILVVLVIFGIIVTTIFGSFHSVFHTVEPLKEDLEIYLMAQNCLDRMVLDLQSVHVALPPDYRPPDINDPPDPYQIHGETVALENESFARLRFTGLAHLPLGKTRREGIAEIIYYVERSNEDQLVLRRSDRLYPYESTEENRADPILCEFIKRLSITYYDQEGSDSDRWDSDSDEFKHATPRAIGILLEVGEADRSITLNTMVDLPVFRKNRG